METDYDYLSHIMTVSFENMVNTLDRVGLITRAVYLPHRDVVKKHLIRCF